MSYQYQQNQSYPYFQSSQQNYPYSNEYYEPPIIQEIGVINEERLEYIPTRSGQESLIYNQSHFEKFQKDEKQICQVLKANGYNLSHIFCIGGFGILVHGSTKEEQNLAIKIVQNQDQNAINKEKEIHKLLKEENHLIKLIVHITVVDGWDAFIYQKYKSSLDQEYKDYEQRKKTFTEQSLLTFVFDLIHGLIELRRASIIHLDIKKKNILISENGKLVYCDFGISEIKKEKQIIKCRGFTKKQYSPQEQIYAELNYKIDFESDIYSLGKILQDLINLFIQLNPESQLFTFAEGLLQIIKDQMIQEDIKLRSNCYQVHSKVYQLFKKIPLKFICNNQEFEKLEYEIKQYLELNPDYCIKKLNQYQETLFNQNNNNNNNNKLNIDQSKLLENSQIQINKSFLDLKQCFIKNEFSKFQESSIQYLNDFYQSVLKLNSKDNQEKEVQKTNIQGIIDNIQLHLSSLQVDEIKKFMEDFKTYLREKLTSNILNFTLENFIKEIDNYRIHTVTSIQEFDQFLFDYDDIDIIVNDLKILQQKQVPDNIVSLIQLKNIYLHTLFIYFLNQQAYLLKDSSIEDLQYLYNNLMNKLSIKQIKLNYKNALRFTKDSKNKIEQFFKEVNELKINALQKSPLQEIELKFEEAIEKYQDFDFMYCFKFII
ncbi:hypothetical protein ABPG74_007995 [Tetrahymena malaccensis]